MTSIFTDGSYRRCWLCGRFRPYWCMVMRVKGLWVCKDGCPNKW